MAATHYDVTQIDNLLKVMYQRGLPYLLYKKSPWFAWIRKNEKFKGKSNEVTVIYGGSVAYTTFSDSAGEASVAPSATFTVTRKKDFAHGYLDNEALVASEDDDGALEHSMRTAMKGAMYGIERSTEFQLLGPGGGARGQISSAVTGTTITLADRQTVRWFQRNMLVQLSADDGITGSAGVKDSGATVQIVSINRKDGMLTANANWNTISGAANGDFIFKKDEYQNVCESIFKWIPKTESAAATTYLGQDRSIDTFALAGIRVDAAGFTPEEALIEASAEGDFHGADIECWWVSSKRFAEFQKNVHSRTFFDTTVKPEAGVSIRALAFHAKGGEQVVMCDPGFPDDYALGTVRSAWELRSARKWPFFAKEDGLRFARTHSEDSIEFTIKRYGNQICHEPLNNVLVKFAA